METDTSESALADLAELRTRFATLPATTVLSESAMAAHSDNADVLVPGLVILVQLPTTGEYRAPLTAHVPAVMSAMAEHGDVAVVVALGVRFVVNLAGVSPSQLQHIAHVDGG